MFRKLLATALSCLLGATCSLLPIAAQAQTSVTGQWTKLNSLPLNPVHNVFLPNGKVMLWSRDNTQRTWDPATQAVTLLPNAGYDLFCAGHTLLADGRVLITGGHVIDFVGLPRTSIYDPVNNTWSPVPDMNAGRWYPTNTVLPNGDVLVVSGQIDSTLGVNPLPQVYQTATNTWRDLTSAQLNQPLYPMMFVAPNGKVINVGPSDVVRYLDTTGTGSWSPLTFRAPVYRDYGSAVMFDGKIMITGGGDPPTASTEVVDLNAATPTWRSVASMSSPRRHVNATLLPDGSVLATGGTSGPGHNNTATAVFTAELWNPTTETWSTMASASAIRAYHSGALLLPDGRVLTTGGDNVPDVEIFSPPYLFKGARPTMSGVPASIGYGQKFSVLTPNSTSIRKVTLIKLAAVTHAFNQNQRLNTLQFTSRSGALDITAPANANLAQPGHYMLFIVNSTGVPSIGGIVQLGGTGATPPPPPPPPAAPTVSSIAPATATAGGPAFTLTVNGTNFVSGASVLWNGAARTTTFVSATQVTAAIPATDIAAASTAQVSVTNPGASASGTVPFTVAAPSGGGGTCVPYPDWVGTIRYLPGDKVTRLGQYYVSTPVTASVWNVNSPPEWTPQYWAVTPCPPNATPPPPATTTTFTVTVTRNGTATTTGTVTSSPAGISCGSACSSTFASGATVTLSTAAATGGVFAGWGGACTGTATCTLTMNANQAVTATFNSTAPPPPPPPPPGTCVPYPAWVGTIRYLPGDKVTRLGQYYVSTPLTASVWNVNSPPEWTPQYWAVTTCP